jgi:hypothetical protein
MKNVVSDSDAYMTQVFVPLLATRQQATNRKLNSPNLKYTQCTFPCKSKGLEFLDLYLTGVFFWCNGQKVHWFCDKKDNFKIQIFTKLCRCNLSTTAIASTQ